MHNPGTLQCIPTDHVVEAIQEILNRLVSLFYCLTIILGIRVIQQVAVPTTFVSNCFTFLEIGYGQDSPTPLYEDNMSAINVINNHVPAERSCHIEISFCHSRFGQGYCHAAYPWYPIYSRRTYQPLGWVLYSRHF